MCVFIESQKYDHFIWKFPLSTIQAFPPIYILCLFSSTVKWRLPPLLLHCRAVITLIHYINIANILINIGEDSWPHNRPFIKEISTEVKTTAHATGFLSRRYLQRWRQLPTQQDIYQGDINRSEDNYSHNKIFIKEILTEVKTTTHTTDLLSRRY